MVVGALSLVQKGKPVDTVCSRIAVYDDGDIVFRAKGQTSGHSMQYTVHSGIVVYGGGDTVFGAEDQTSGCSGCST